MIICTRSNYLLKPEWCDFVNDRSNKICICFYCASNGDEKAAEKLKKEADKYFGDLLKCIRLLKGDQI